MYLDNGTYIYMNTVGQRVNMPMQYIAIFKAVNIDNIHITGVRLGHVKNELVGFD